MFKCRDLYYVILKENRHKRCGNLCLILSVDVSIVTTGFKRAYLYLRSLRLNFVSFKPSLFIFRFGEIF